MTSQQPKPAKSRSHYQVVSAALALLVLMLSLASASPTLHDWLHADTECSHHHDDHGAEHSDTSEDPDNHACAVTLLNSGATLSIQVELPQLGDALIALLSVQQEAIFYERPGLPQSARGPPTIIVV